MSKMKPGNLLSMKDKLREAKKIYPESRKKKKQNDAVKSLDPDHTTLNLKIEEHISCLLEKTKTGDNDTHENTKAEIKLLKNAKQYLDGHINESEFGKECLEQPCKHLGPPQSRTDTLLQQVLEDKPLGTQAFIPLK